METKILPGISKHMKTKKVCKMIEDMETEMVPQTRKGI